MVQYNMNNIYFKEIQKMEDKEDEEYYKLGEMRKWNLDHSDSKLSLTV